MSARKKRQQSPAAKRLSCSVWIERALDLVFKARAVVDCCIYASDSLLASKDGRPNQQPALEGAHDLLSQAADELDDA